MVENYISNGIRKCTFSKIRDRPISTQVLDQTRNRGMGPRGLDPCPFQQKNESDFFAVPSLFNKGVYLKVENAWFQKFSKVFVPSPHFSFPNVIGSGKMNHLPSDYYFIIIIISIFYRWWSIQLSWFARGRLFTK